MLDVVQAEGWSSIAYGMVLVAGLTALALVIFGLVAWKVASRARNEDLVKVLEATGLALSSLLRRGSTKPRMKRGGR
ncbi:hypothetical protein [Streptomyces microflavus]|uniref:hypothetical protein n=1 Tax=Streptomyces microflavus TaxID=1919 RepID=UPI003663FAFF